MDSFDITAEDAPPLSAEDLATIEQRHYRRAMSDECRWDADTWPCETIRLWNEVRKAREEPS